MKKNTKRIILAFVISLLVTLVALLAYAYFKGDGKPADDGQQGGSSEQENEPKNENGASFEYSGKATIDYDAKIVELYFKNPLRSTRNIVLEVKCNVDGEEVTFAKTDQLVPGEEVKRLTLLSDKVLPEGRHAGRFMLHFYNSDGQEEIVNSKININLFVR